MQRCSRPTSPSRVAAAPKDAEDRRFRRRGLGIVWPGIAGIESFGEVHCEAALRQITEPIQQIARRAGQRVGWWAEPSGRGDGVYVIQSETGLIADGLTQNQAMTVAAEYNLARTDAGTLADRFCESNRRSA